MTSDEKSWVPPALGIAAIAGAATAFGLVRAHGNAPAQAALDPIAAPAAALSDAFKTAAKTVAPSVVSIMSLDQRRRCRRGADAAAGVARRSVGGARTFSRSATIWPAHSASSIRRGCSWRT